MSDTTTSTLICIALGAGIVWVGMVVADKLRRNRDDR